MANDRDSGKIPVSDNTKRNAFSELMSPKRKPPPPPPSPSPSSRGAPTDANDRRSGLLLYINNPDAYPSQVISQDADFVLIRDLYPKATVHLLLLPRDPTKYLLHPHDAFTDPIFLSQCHQAATSAAQLASKELQRLLGQDSASERPRRLVLDAGANDDDDDVPPGRDWLKEIRVGVHAHPSMTHLHVHIISRDMHSECVKHRKHYSSFNTDFFIPLADYPLDEGDERRSVRHQNANLRDVGFTCWRCGRGFGNRFKELKAHLEEEFRDWREE